MVDANSDPVPPRTPITVVSPAKWADAGNAYFVGETVFAETAGYAGGLTDTTTYRWRIQTRDSADGSWINGSWTNYTDHAEEVSFPLTATGQVRFQCQARDTGVDPVEQINSFAGVKDVGQRTIGTLAVTVDDIANTEDDVVPTRNGLDHVIVATTDGDATGLQYDFTLRSGQARLSITGNSCIVSIQGASPGSVAIDIRIQDPNTVEQQVGQRVSFYIGE